MEIHFVSNEEYQQRYDSIFWQQWTDLYPRSLCLYEGGWSNEAISGSQRWWEKISSNIVVCAVGSGCTLAGLISAAPEGVKVIGVPAFKDPDNYRSLVDKLQNMGIDASQYELWVGYAGKGFGRLSAEQKTFQEQFSAQTGIQLDPVYTSKVFHALSVELEKPCSRIIHSSISIIHTGGLQGCRS